MNPATLESWPRCPEAAAYLERLLDRFAADNAPVASMAARFLEGAGVNLANLVDHWALQDSPDQRADLAQLGFKAQ